MQIVIDCSWTVLVETAPIQFDSEARLAGCFDRLFKHGRLQAHRKNFCRIMPARKEPLSLERTYLPAAISRLQSCMATSSHNQGHMLLDCFGNFCARCRVATCRQHYGQRAQAQTNRRQLPRRWVFDEHYEPTRITIGINLLWTGSLQKVCCEPPHCILWMCSVTAVLAFIIAASRLAVRASVSNRRLKAFWPIRADVVPPNRQHRICIEDNAASVLKTTSHLY